MATGPERHGWRVNIETPAGVEAIGVLVAEAGDVWRARILTYPKVLWVVPGGSGTIKFVGRTPREAEEQAIEFIREHCRERDYSFRDELALVEPEALPDSGPIRRPQGDPAQRKVRFLPVRFGVARPTETGGTGNLSETGIFIITDAPVDEGQWVEMELELEREHVDLRGFVRWSRADHHAGRAPGMGVQLEQPSGRYLRYVRTLP
ncbi:hypothetical protein ABI59_01790 [Acidobacteria bacterium Mor1]|nr:hypothetical protein ABI59_01790 [Acidobacteria bacterium Mor1]